MTEKKAVIIRTGKKENKSGYSRLIVGKRQGVSLEEIAKAHYGGDYQVIIREHLKRVEVSGFERAEFARVKRRPDREIDAKLKDIEDRFAKTISKLEEEVFNLTENYESFKRNVYKNDFLRQQGAELNELTQIIPIRVYLANDKGSDKVEEAVQGYIESVDGEIIEDYKPIYGSWFKEWFARIYNGKTKEQIDNGLEKARKAIELKTISKPQSEVDLNNSTALSTLMLSIANQEYAVIQVGALLIAKYTKDGKAIVVSKVLTVNEVIWLENNQQLLSSPESLISGLSMLDESQNKLMQIK